MVSRLLENSFLPEKYANSPMNLRVNFQTHRFFSILLANKQSISMTREVWLTLIRVTNNSHKPKNKLKE